MKQRLNSGLAKFKNIRKPFLQWGILRLLLIGTLAMSVLAVPRLANVVTNPSARTKNQLVSQVDTETGAPKNGRDPASQQQSTLASAATKPAPSGNPSSGTSDQSSAQDNTTSHEDHDHTQVVSDPKDTGVLASGCLANYGKPGEQCLPAYAIDPSNPSCDGVLKEFPKGIQVTGGDRYHLDKNQDGVACDAADL